MATPFWNNLAQAFYRFSKFYGIVLVKDCDLYLVNTLLKQTDVMFHNFF
jgi:hypothetical protein